MQDADAERVLAMREKIDIDPAQRATIKADYASRHANLQEALAHERSAVEAAPQNPALWRRLILRYLQMGDGKSVMKPAKVGNRIDV